MPASPPASGTGGRPVSAVISASRVAPASAPSAAPPAPDAPPPAGEGKLDSLPHAAAVSATKTTPDRILGIVSASAFFWLFSLGWADAPMAGVQLGADR